MKLVEVRQKTFDQRTREVRGFLLDRFQMQEQHQREIEEIKS